ncbi:glypican-5 isoform X2 [Latimeria chalumnae]|uniref:glypican-5 isoform X2 n=1 Tax=Latimeria chalumnae TaxID=7897 RepID=UPI00313B4ABE
MAAEAGPRALVMTLLLCVCLLWGCVAAPGVGALRSPSCHEVRTAFQLRQIGSLKWVPDVPTNDSNLHICEHKGPTCCTKRMEDSYQVAVQREIQQNMQPLSFELKYLIVGHATAFQETFDLLIGFAADHTCSLFDTTYGTMAKEARESVKELFTDISLYILGSDNTVEEAVPRFFDSLFPLVYSRLINPGMSGMTEEYAECLRMTQQDVNPFGPHPKAMVNKLSKSMQATRALSQALSVGVEVVTAMEQVAFTRDCSRALVKMQYCSHCQGLTLIRPCAGYCLNVMRGCLASVAEVDIHWREYITMLDELTNDMAGSHDLELALLSVRNLVNEAILHAQLNGPRLSATVDKVCGQPEGGAAQRPPDNVIQPGNASDVIPPAAALSARLANRRREFMNYMRRYKTFYASLAEQLCNRDLVVQDSSTCWNGEDVVESYTNRVVSNGLKAQVDNPEVRVKGSDSVITHVIEKLAEFNQMLQRRGIGESGRWPPPDGASGDGPSEGVEASGECDDEDGCQASGDDMDETKIHVRISKKEGQTVFLEGKDQLNTAGKKMDTTTATLTTAKSSSKGKLGGSAPRQAASSSVLLAVTMVMLLCHHHS